MNSIIAKWYNLINKKDDISNLDLITEYLPDIQQYILDTIQYAYDNNLKVSFVDTDEYNADKIRQGKICECIVSGYSNDTFIIRDIDDRYTFEIRHEYDSNMMEAAYYIIISNNGIMLKDFEYAFIMCPYELVGFFKGMLLTIIDKLQSNDILYAWFILNNINLLKIREAITNEVTR